MAAFGGLMTRGTRLLLAAIVAAVLAPASPTHAAEATIGRLWGADRYATAAAISQATFAPGVPVAFVATGQDFPDSLAGGPAAARLRAPMLLTLARGLPDATRAELSRLQPARIVILGGTTVVSPTVEAQLAAYTAGGVTRIAGADRYATAAAVSAAYFPAGVPVAYVATGATFPDALTAGAAAAALGGPVLLVRPTGFPVAVQTELQRLGPGRIVVVGGPAAVADTVLDQLRAATGASVTRTFGADRYATSAAISAEAFPFASKVHLATGLSFADAVAGVPAAAAARGPLLLTTRVAVPSPTFTELRRLLPSEVVLLGGESAVSSAVVPSIQLATWEPATALERVGPHSFRSDGHTLQALPADMLAFEGTSLVEIYGTRDATGAVQFLHTDGQWYDHPVGQAQYVVNMLRNYRISPDPEYLRLAIANAERLLARAVRHQGAIFFPYGFDFVLHGRGTMRAPWYSGMAQGIALSGFVRLYQVTSDARWLQAAHETFASFTVARQDGNPWVATVENDLLWLELYPWLPLDHTYNGHNFASFGLYDYWRLTDSADAEQLLIGAITTTERFVNIARVPGGVSNYCLAQSCLDRRVRNPDYHLSVIGQFIQLYRYTRNETFGRLADAFTADYPNFRSGGTVGFQAGTHTASQFDTNGTRTDGTTAAVGASSASYAQRTVPYGWIAPGNGIWFYMTDGPFAGQWIRESPSAIARGFVDRLEYYWPRPVAVTDGQHSGYRLAPDGTITETNTVTSAAGTWEYTASARINGQPAVSVSSGPLAGYWLAVDGLAGSGPTAAGAVLTTASTGEVQMSAAARVAAPPEPPFDPLLPPLLPGQDELGPVDGP